MQGSLYYLESRPIDPETGQPVTASWLLNQGWKVLLSRPLGELLHGAPGAEPIQGSVRFISDVSGGWRWIQADLEDNLRANWPDLPQSLKGKLLQRFDSVTDFLRWLRRNLLEATWEEQDETAQTVRKRARIADVPTGATILDTGLPAHYWAGDEG